MKYASYLLRAGIGFLDFEAMTPCVMVELYNEIARRNREEINAIEQARESARARRGRR